MNSKNRSAADQELLEIRLSPSHLHVSYFSSLLRVVQVALREVSQSNDGTRRYFDKRPHPILMLSNLDTNDDLTLHFTFADSRDSTPLKELSSRAFNALLDQVGEFVRSLPQPSLWGGAARRPPQRHFESELKRRMDQLYRELRRSPKATIRFQNRTIEVEGDRMEIM